MKDETQSWLYEGREFLGNAEDKFAKASSLNAGAVENLVKAYEYGIKAPIVETHGCVPVSFQNHRLISLCQSGGLWSLLPVHLQDAIREIEPFYPCYRGKLAYETLVSSSTPGQWGGRIKAANQFLDFIEKRVVCDSVTFNRLTF